MEKNKKKKLAFTLWKKKTSGQDPNEQKQHTCFHYNHIDCIINTKNLIHHRENLFNS